MEGGHAHTDTRGREGGREGGAYLGKDELGLAAVQIKDGGRGAVPHKLDLGDEEAVGALVQGLREGEEGREGGREGGRKGCQMCAEAGKSKQASKQGGREGGREGHTLT